MGTSYSKYLVNDPSAFATKASDSSTSGRHYDYVIVGGGTAGCVLASRLSEDASCTVLLIEAGSGHDSEIYTRIPLAISKTFGSRADWNFYTSSQTTLDSREVYWPRGKILGGTSAINALIFHHCAPEDFVAWAMQGARGWDYASLKPFFLKSEKYAPNTVFPGVDTTNRGMSGPWHTGHCVGRAPINDIVAQACGTLGMPYNDDLNTSSGTMGVSHLIGILDGKGQRSSTATAYLTPDVLARPNLTVAVNCMVEKIVFKAANGRPRACGIELSTDPSGPRYSVKASREVILCGGAVGSPQLLLISGIGPAAELSELGIPVVKDHPAVGKHLADHITTGPVHLRAKPGMTWEYLQDPLPGLLALARWMVFGTGPLSTIPTATGIFFRSDDTSLPLHAKEPQSEDHVEDLSSGPSAPDLEVLFTSQLVIDNGNVKPANGVHGITMGAVVLKPKSSGEIKLKSGSIWDKPIIDPHYFAEENDMNVCVRGLRFMLNLARTEPLKTALDLPAHSEDKDSIFWPADADPGKVTDDELRAYIRRNATCAFHPTSTARMGTDPYNSVVNTDLCVHGVDALRVVDASVFPTQVSGHPCAVVVAIAEKIADKIKETRVI